MNKTSWIIFAVACVGLLAALVFWTKDNKATGIKLDDIDVSKPISKEQQKKADPEGSTITEHTIGKKDSKVTFIEYADYQCPGCAAIHDDVTKRVEENKDDIAFVFRVFPIPNHSNAKAAVAAVEAAGFQGKFWEMQHLVFAEKSSWESLDAQKRTDRFVELAISIGLDKDKFKKDMGSDSILKKIAFDQAVAAKAGVTATPTFFLNGEKVETNVLINSEKFKELVKSKL